MRYFLLICAVVMGQSVLAADRNLIADENVERAIRKEINKLKGELTKADLEKVKSLGLETPPIAEKITDASLDGLAHLTQLRFLKLSNTKITNLALHEVAKFKLLEVLHLNNTEIDDGCIEQLIKLTKLRKLKVKDAKLSKEGEARLRKSMPKKCKVIGNHKE